MTKDVNNFQAKNDFKFDWIDKKKVEFPTNDDTELQRLDDVKTQLVGGRGSKGWGGVHLSDTCHQTTHYWQQQQQQEPNGSQWDDLGDVDRSKWLHWANRRHQTLFQPKTLKISIGSTNSWILFYLVSFCSLLSRLTNTTSFEGTKPTVAVVSSRICKYLPMDWVGQLFNF